jgi:hypothetical protein
MTNPSQITLSQTRQQLEEIDALLQRMLSIPTSEVTAPLAEPVREAFVSTPPLTTPALTIKPLPLPQHNPLPEPVVQSWRVEIPVPPVPRAEPVVETAPWAIPMEQPTPPPAPTLPFRAEVQAPTPVRVLPFSVQPLPVQEAPATLPMQAAQSINGIPYATAAPPADPGPPVPWLLWPIILFSRLLDFIFQSLGPLGRATRPGGKAFFGVLGIFLLLLAGGWAVCEWLGFDVVAYIRSLF